LRAGVVAWNRLHPSDCVRITVLRDRERGRDAVIYRGSAVLAGVEIEQFGRARGVRAILRHHRQFRSPATLILALEARETRRHLRATYGGRRIVVRAVRDLVPRSAARNDTIDALHAFLRLVLALPRGAK
jgi:hypothetical protein